MSKAWSSSKVLVDTGTGSGILFWENICYSFSVISLLLLSCLAFLIKDLSAIGDFEWPRWLEAEDDKHNNSFNVEPNRFADISWKVGD
ncbi:1299_t:CDS:2 [Funneliformis geosporum]|nr:1299_t:CDS:2 [Funneliformis geosporum]